MFKKKGLCLAVLVVVALLGFSSAGYSLEVYGKTEHVTWKEYEGGSQLLKESGWLYGLGVTHRFLISPVIIQPQLEIFGGRVDYKGQITAGTPVDTDTSYFVTSLIGDVRYPVVVSKNMSVEPLLGLGYRYWTRSLETTTVGNITAVGYTEVWDYLYGRLGVHSIFAFTGKTFLTTTAGVKLPIWSKMNSNLYNLGLKPEGRSSVFADIGIQHKRLTVGLFYEGLRFGASPVVSGFYQPESKADIYGLKIGLIF